WLAADQLESAHLGRYSCEPLSQLLNQILTGTRSLKHIDGGVRQNSISGGDGRLKRCVESSFFFRYLRSTARIAFNSAAGLGRTGNENPDIVRRQPLDLRQRKGGDAIAVPLFGHWMAIDYDRPTTSILLYKRKEMLVEFGYIGGRNDLGRVCADLVLGFDLRGSCLQEFG